MSPGNSVCKGSSITSFRSTRAAALACRPAEHSLSARSCPRETGAELGDSGRGRHVDLGVGFVGRIGANLLESLTLGKRQSRLSAASMAGDPAGLDHWRQPLYRFWFAELFKPPGNDFGGGNLVPARCSL